MSNEDNEEECIRHLRNLYIGVHYLQAKVDGEEVLSEIEKTEHDHLPSDALQMLREFITKRLDAISELEKYIADTENGDTEILTNDILEQTKEIYKMLVDRYNQIARYKINYKDIIIRLD